MREVNFSIPNANKASVGITTALYDRRALDCTSTLPLINSLNNLAYLTTSSGRIRDILTVDGGIERLVCILKEGRSKDMMEMWKWNLAFQCIVNIGVRGSEAVRRRVVEADMVPVIATILDNYFQVMEKCKERAELENRRRCPFGSSKASGRSADRRDTHEHRVASRSRRHVPPPISIPEPGQAAGQGDQNEPSSETTPTGPAANLSLSSPPERTTFRRVQLTQQALDQRALEGQARLLPPYENVRAPLSAIPSHSMSPQAYSVRPVRDADRLPSMLPTLRADLSSGLQSPATPNDTPMAPLTGARPRRRPSIRHQLSVSGSDDDGQLDLSVRDELSPTPREAGPVVEIQTDIVMQDLVDEDDISETRNTAVTLAVPDMLSNEDETINITHRSADGSAIINGVGTPTQAGQLPFPQTQMPNPVGALNTTPPNLQQTPAWYGGRSLSSTDRPAPASILAAMPRDEDVLMSLQLLAYVSKYCYLRSYFASSHLVPRLKVGHDLRLLDPDYNPALQPGPSQEDLENEWDNEFVQKPGEKPFNIFPLIEKFTAKPSSSRHAVPVATDSRGDMQYWAGVVMRNLCRKDDTRGGIRQCAYWQCGKWEETARQFAKCRRCRRTKYCSKECQKGAWGSHRFWCVAADDNSSSGANPNPNGGSNDNSNESSHAEAASSEVAGGERSSRRHHHIHHSRHHHHHHHEQQPQQHQAPRDS